MLNQKYSYSVTKYSSIDWSSFYGNIADKSGTKSLSKFLYELVYLVYCL